MTTLPKIKKYRVLRDRVLPGIIEPGEKQVARAGDIVYRQRFHDYGLASDDTRATGVEHISVTHSPDGDYPGFTIPLSDLEEIVDDAPEAAAFPLAFPAQPSVVIEPGYGVRVESAEAWKSGEPIRVLYPDGYVLSFQPDADTEEVIIPTRLRDGIGVNRVVPVQSDPEADEIDHELIAPAPNDPPPGWAWREPNGAPSDDNPMRRAVFVWSDEQGQWVMERWLDAQPAKVPGADVRRIEVDFAYPVDISHEHYATLHDVIEKITAENVPEGHVHWLFGCGSKPVFSRADRRFMGLPDDPSAPEDGEPSWDHGILHFETACRPKHKDASV